MKKLLILGAIAMAAVAFSATQFTNILNLKVSGLTLLGTTTESNAIKNTVVVDADYNFASATTTCSDSWAFTATGVKAGNPCFIGMGPRDGGVQSVVAINSTFWAFSDADNTVKVRHCPAGTAIDPPDSGFVVRCFNAPGQ